MADLTLCTSCIVDHLKATIEYLECALKPLIEFVPEDDEQCFDTTELATFINRLIDARNAAEQCYSLYTQKLQAASDKDTTPLKSELTEHKPISENPIIRGGLLASLSEVINTLQVLIRSLEFITLKDGERVYNIVEVEGLRNIVGTIKAASEYCIEQCPVE